MQSNNNTVGIPTMAFGCLPVPPRHSQVNFLSYVDPTGLHRVAYLGAALAAVFGWTDGRNADRLINEVFGAGRSKLIQESDLALAALAEADGHTIAAAFKRGQVLLRSGLERERAMLQSIEPLLPGDKDALRLIGRRVKEETDLADSLSVQFGGEYRRRCGELGCRPQQAAISAEERELDGLIPKPVPGIMGTSAYFGNYYEKLLGKEKLDSFELAPDFSYGHVGYTEAHNFINGRRSILEIYQAVDSELWSEGYPAAHAISLREVASYMRMLEAAKVITLEVSHD